MSATYSYLTQFLSSSLPQNPLVTHETDFSRLRDSAFLDRTLRYRTARLLQTAAMRLQKHTARLGAFDAWNKCLSHLLLLATAHIEWVIFDKTMAAARRCKDSGCRGALKCMADIFALSVRPPLPSVSHIVSPEAPCVPLFSQCVSSETSLARGERLLGIMVDSYTLTGLTAVCRTLC